MKLSPSSQSLIERTIQKAIGRYSLGGEQTIVTDIHLQPHQTSGEFTLYDDDDAILAETTIEEWMTYEGDDFYEACGRILSALLDKMNKAKAFDSLSIIKPYSFVLVDEEKETVSELLLVDDDTLLVNDELLKGLDEELDTFLKKLLED